MNRPCLRYVDVFPLTVEGQRGFFLRDPLNFSEHQLFLSEGAIMILAFLDGEHDVEQIRQDIVRRWKVDVAKEQIEAFITSLDEALMLDSERFQAHFKALQDGFHAAPTRPASHAGKAYTAEPEELRKLLDGFLADLAKYEDAPPPSNRRALAGLIAPHIDFRRGQPVYAYGYDTLRGADHDLFVVFGTSHGPIEGYGGYYALTRKHYETPLGILETPLEVVDALERRLGAEVLAGEFAHRAEHSIEFQAVWLQYLFSGAGKVRMLPILCGSFFELMQAGKTPADIPEIRDFLQAVQEEVGRVAKNPCYIAGADLAHIGPKFGDTRPAEGDFVEAMQAADQRSLAALSQGDPEGFIRAIHAEKDRYRICGISSIYSVARVLAGKPAQVLKYSYWPDPNDTVSFVSAAVHA